MANQRHDRAQEGSPKDTAHRGRPQKGGKRPSSSPAQYVTQFHELPKAESVAVGEQVATPQYELALNLDPKRFRSYKLKGRIPFFSILPWATKRDWTTQFLLVERRERETVIYAGSTGKGMANSRPVHVIDSAQSFEQAVETFLTEVAGESV